MWSPLLSTCDLLWERVFQFHILSWLTWVCYLVISFQSLQALFAKSTPFIESHFGRQGLYCLWHLTHLSESGFSVVVNGSRVFPSLHLPDRILFARYYPSRPLKTREIWSNIWKHWQKRCIFSLHIFAIQLGIKYLYSWNTLFLIKMPFVIKSKSKHWKKIKFVFVGINYSKSSARFYGVLVSYQGLQVVLAWRITSCWIAKHDFIVRLFYFTKGYSYVLKFIYHGNLTKLAYTKGAVNLFWVAW